MQLKYKIKLYLILKLMMSWRNNLAFMNYKKNQPQKSIGNVLTIDNKKINVKESLQQIYLKDLSIKFLKNLSK
jgi:hypothetical protein